MAGTGASGAVVGTTVEERSFMEKTLGERERASRTALSLGPHRLKPVPAVLSLSSRSLDAHRSPSFLPMAA